MQRGIQMPDYETAIKLYYGRTELSNNDIRELFGGKISSGTIVKLKKMAKQEMVKEDIYTWQPNHVNTKIAYKTWNLDINEMEKNYNKLKKMGLG